MSQEIVNLRSVANGPLLGTATLPEMTGHRYPDDEPKLLSWQGRLFAFVSGSFSFAGSITAEYVEVFPVAVDVIIAK